MVEQVKDAKNAPPYDPESVCSKCGFADVGTHLCDGSYCNRFLRTMPWDRETEHIDRTCRRCGYHWWEKPLKEAS